MIGAIATLAIVVICLYFNIDSLRDEVWDQKERRSEQYRELSDRIQELERSAKLLWGSNERAYGRIKEQWRSNERVDDRITELEEQNSQTGEVQP